MGKGWQKGDKGHLPIGHLSHPMRLKGAGCDNFEVFDNFEVAFWYLKTRVRKLERWTIVLVQKT